MNDVIRSLILFNEFAHDTNNYKIHFVCIFAFNPSLSRKKMSIVASRQNRTHHTYSSNIIMYHLKLLIKEQKTKACLFTLSIITRS